MKRAHFTIAAGLFVVACGGGGSNNNPDASNSHIDAPNNTQIDAADTHVDAAHPTDGSTTTVDGSTTTDGGTATCISTTLGTQDFLGGSVADGSIAWDAPITADLGDGGAAQLNLEFYDMVEPDLMGTFDLTAGNQANYSTCAICVLGLSGDASGNVARIFYQSGGTMTLTEDPFVAGNMKGTITGLALDEVTIDDSNVSTPVAGGKCILIGDVTLNHVPVPNAWTCAAAKYNDGATCDCMCGLSDPDCGITAVPVAGCTGTQICPADTCEAWSCPVVSYNDGTNCNCGCGEHDPDCDITGAPVVGCTGTQVCGTNDMCMDFVPPACTVNAALGTPTLMNQASQYDSADDMTELAGFVNADTLPDGFDLQLWNTFGVFANGVVPGTYTISGDETGFFTCGACAFLDGDIDSSSGTATPTQQYQANAGTLTLTSTTGTLTGTLTNATFAAFTFDADGNQIPDGSNCTVSVTSLSFSASITAAAKKSGRIHISNITNVKGMKRAFDKKVAGKHTSKLPVTAKSR